MINNILFTHDDLDGAGCRIVFNRHFHHWLEGISNKLVHSPGIHRKIVHSSAAKIDEVVTHTLETEKNLGGPGNLDIWFADICPSETVLNGLIEKYDNRHIHIYDHHKTATWVNSINIDGGCRVYDGSDQTTLVCGTSLLYDKLRPELPDMIERAFARVVEAVRLYDTWEWSNDPERYDYARRLNIMFKLLGMDYFCRMFEQAFDRYIHQLITSNELPEVLNYDSYEEYDRKLVSLILFGNNEIAPSMFIAAKDYQEDQIIEKFLNDFDRGDPEVKAYIAEMQCFTRVFDGYDGDMDVNCLLLTKNLGVNIGLLGDRFLRRFPQFNVFIYFNGTTLSFRTIDNRIDVSDLAKRLGGGGHQKAAGAPVPSEIIQQMIQPLVDHIENN